MVHEVRLRLLCKRPEIVKKSLEPDITNSKNLKTEIRSEQGLVEITVKGEKLSHLKAIINSYLSIISTLDQMENIK